MFNILISQTTVFKLNNILKEIVEKLNKNKYLNFIY
jgi:hypothetical protein